MSNDEVLPAPLVDAEVDLRDFQYMELDVRLLRDSRFGAEVSGDAFRAGVMLWCASWHQVPAGSVPDDDIELANLAGYGRFVKEWRKERAQALQGFIKCSDGRLYHAMVCKKAQSAWDAKLQHHYERARDRLRKGNKARAAANQPQLPEFTFEQWNQQRLSRGVPMEKAEASAGIPQNAAEPAGGIPPENALKGNGEGKGEGKGEGEGDISSSEPNGSGAEAPPGPPPPPPPPPDLTKAELWSAGKSLLESQGMPTKQCGTFVGKLVKDYGDEIVIDVVRSAVVERPADAASWLLGACKQRAGQRPRRGAVSEAERAAVNAQANAEAAALLFGQSTQEAINA